MLSNKTVRSTDVTPIGPEINGPKNFLVAGQEIISLCVYYDLYDKYYGQNIYLENFVINLGKFYLADLVALRTLQLN